MLPTDDLQNDVIVGHSLPNPDSPLGPVLVQVKSNVSFSRPNQTCCTEKLTEVLQCLDTLPPSSWAGTFSNIILVWYKNTAVVVEDVVSKVVTLGWVNDTAWRVGLSGSLQFVEELRWESAN